MTQSVYSGILLIGNNARLMHCVYDRYTFTLYITYKFASMLQHLILQLFSLHYVFDVNTDNVIL